MLRLLLPLLLALVPACASVQSPPEAPLWGSLEPGRFGVGFDTRWISDPTRADWRGAPGRPIQLWSWYPGSGGARMSLLDYGRLSTAADAGRPTDWLADPAAIFGIGDDALPEGGLEKVAAIPVAARHGGRPAHGRFPLVVMALGWSYESPVQQHLLAEYLASHGYVVVASPLVGARTRAAAVTAEDLDAQIRDVAFLIDAARGPQVDSRRIALFGFDLGGMSVVAAAARRSDVDAVVGFDSGVLSPRLIDQLLAPRSDFSFSRFTAPYLHATRTRAENEARKLDETLAAFENAPVERLLVRVPGMRHADFALPGAIEAAHPGFWGPVEGNPAAKQQALLDLVRRFLDRHLKGAKASVDAAPPLTIQHFGPHSG